MKTRTYDSKCWDLADAFISDSQIKRDKLEAKDELASMIQQLIEDWFENVENEEEPA